MSCWIAYEDQFLSWHAHSCISDAAKSAFRSADKVVTEFRQNSFWCRTQFTAGIATDQIWLRKVANNLEVSLIGKNDKMTISNWYLGNQYHVEAFQTADGKTLLDSQVQNLVQAMAVFAPPAAGQTTLPANYQALLGPQIAANWH